MPNVDDLVTHILRTKMYSYKRNGVLFPSYIIMFEDTPIREVAGLQNVKDITNLLNTAWQLGASTALTYSSRLDEDD